MLDTGRGDLVRGNDREIYSRLSYLTQDGTGTVAAADKTAAARIQSSWLDASDDGSATDYDAAYALALELVRSTFDQNLFR